MPRQLLPAEASSGASAALARAGFTVLSINSNRAGTDLVITTVRVRVSVGDADRVRAVLRALDYTTSVEARWSGGAYEVTVTRRVGMAGG
jgi:hypothetical protein